MYRFKKDGFYGAVSIKGIVFYEPIFQYLDGFFEGVSSGLTAEGALCLVSAEEVLRIDEQSVEYLHRVSCGRVMAQNDDYQTGFLDMKGAWVIPPNYSRAYDFFDGVSTVDQNGSWGALGLDGNVILGFDFDFITQYGAHGAVMQKGESWYLWRKDREIVSLGKFLEVSAPDWGMVIAKQREKMSIFDEMGGQLGEFSSSDLEDLKVARKGLLWMKRNEVWQLVNLDGVPVSDASFLDVSSFSGGAFPVKSISNSKWGLVNETLSWLEPAFFDEINVIDDQVAELSIGNFIMDEDERELVRLKDASRVCSAPH